MSIPATQINFKTELILRNYLPVVVTCEITGEYRPGDLRDGSDTDLEEIEDLKTCHNGFELDLGTAEDLEIRGKVWDEYARIDFERNYPQNSF